MNAPWESFIFFDLELILKPHVMLGTCVVHNDKKKISAINKKSYLFNIFLSLPVSVYQMTKYWDFGLVPAFFSLKILFISKRDFKSFSIECVAIRKL